ncbi:serine/threonine-protein kinase [Anabaena subtropica]|uniref:non-specific serine/threonine protein kinase n=1 Tax=Anabaena subtropica FACHB-260 TaxID=2692884 RepID=A0ABR8CNX5_9NOST|nr:serine/threonine-protein kinase [Anabaena subtropica]MBD2344927.1 protein kinase [Anabaena subtropica FACHB-260]
MTSILLNNRYQVIQVLGAGGFGETWLAEDTHMPSRRCCVIKQLKPISNDPQTYQIIQQRFEREAATLEFLGEHSDQIPRLHAYFSENGQFYLVQEWIHGQTLRSLVEATGYQNESTVRAILLSLLSVLDYVHSKGIIHRDIKPDNIILRDVDQKPVLIDFGAVKETIRSVVSSPKYATQSLVIGTPGYMPSEQAVGRPVYATDIYSLGLTAIYLLTGKSPEELPTHPQTGEILWQNFAPHVSPQFVTVLNQTIKPQAGDRFSTASKMLYALSSGLTTQPSVSPTTAPTQQTQALSVPSIKPQGDRLPWIESDRQKSILVFGSLLVGGLMAGVAMSTLTRQSPSETPVVSNPLPSPVSPSSIPEPITPITPSVPTPTQPPVFSDTRTQENRQDNANSPEAFTPTPDNTPITTDTPAPQPSSTTEPENQPVPEPPIQPDSLPETKPPQPSKANTTRPSVPAFPTGTARSTVEASLGKPNRDLRGLWGNTRAVVYRLIPNQVDLGYLFDRNSGVLRQTEVSFAQSVDPEVMQATLNGMLGGQSSTKIQQGLEQIQQRQSDNFRFTAGGVKGQIVRQNCDLIYISVWEADLHDFVNPASAKRC